MQPTEEKVQAVLDCPRPTSKKAVRSFLGLTGYYRWFIPNYADTAGPLSDLTKKDKESEVTWNATCEKSFQDLKAALCSYPILSNPASDHRFVLRMDASDKGIGAELFQMVEGQRRTLAFLS